MNKLVKSNTNKMIFGVCGGIAEYMNTDPTIVRIIFAVFGITAGTGILAYIILALIMPQPPGQWQ